VGFGAQDLGPQDRLVQVQLAVQFLDGAGLRGQVDHGVDALGLLVDLVGETAAAPDIDLVHVAAGRGDDLEELLKGRLDGALLKRGIEDDHHLVVAHALYLPPLD